jgi:hypothetical protein
MARQLLAPVACAAFLTSVAVKAEAIGSTPF